jgi:hypothetical protein
MPQLDFFSFSPQIIWTSIGICFFYLVFIKYFLRNSTETLKLRDKIKAILEQSFDSSVSPKILYNSIVNFL